MKYSVVIPLKNEEENIKVLIEEIESVMKKIGSPFEVICIDDGSDDQTLTVLKGLATHRPFLRIVCFVKNFGQSSAFAAGFAKASGEFVITLDGDRQNNPADIPLLIAKIDEADLVCGWRVDRRDHWRKKVISKMANQIRGRLCKDGMHDTGCSLKLYRKSALDNIKLYHGMHRFLPALFLLEGYKVREVAVSHRERTKGTTKYNFLNRSIGPIIDMFVVRWMRKKRLKYTIREEL
ncbi:MAG: glycosyltransferase family 2 protein [Chlamydiia bacterium]|nr:glycosyltransferase family 2 protein [Chlamydiia bacterium]